jgi:hypothetical protein
MTKAAVTELETKNKRMSSKGVAARLMISGLELKVINLIDNDVLQTCAMTEVSFVRCFFVDPLQSIVSLFARE